MGTPKQGLASIALLALSLAGCKAAQPAVARTPHDDWHVAYDLDGDGVRDVIIDEFTGGAHCCYKVGAELSSTGDKVMLPFWFDGGIAYPETLIDIPERFAIRSDAFGAPEILLQIATYNGRPEELDPEWTRRYGVRSHCIAASFPGGRVRLRNRNERVNEEGYLSCSE